MNIYIPVNRMKLFDILSINTNDFKMKETHHLKLSSKQVISQLNKPDSLNEIFTTNV